MSIENKNFEIISEENTYFIEAIKKLIEKIILKDEKYTNNYEVLNLLRKKIVDANLMKVFNYVSLEGINRESLCLTDKKEINWIFSLESGNIDFIEVNKIYIGNSVSKKETENVSLKFFEQFLVKHNKEKSFVEGKMLNQDSELLRVNFKDSRLTQEDFDLTKLIYDFDLSFISKMNLEDFYMSKKNKTIFKQNYEKHFGDKLYLLRKKGKK